MSTFLADDPRAAAKVAPALTEDGRRALQERIARLEADVLEPLRPHLIGPDRDERDDGEIERALAESGFDPNYLELEITEGLLMDDPLAAAELLHRVRHQPERVNPMISRALMVTIAGIAAGMRNSG